MKGWVLAASSLATPTDSMKLIIDMFKFNMKKLATGAASIVDGTSTMLFPATVSNWPFDSMTASNDVSVARMKTQKL